MMKKFVASTLLALGVIAFAAPAFADDDVKKLEGQLVPVGEENKYRYSYDSWNITTDPIGFAYGKFSIGLSYAINDILAIRTDADLYKPYMADDGSIGGGAAIAGSLYFKKMYDGFFVEPGFRVFGFNDGSLLYGPMINVGWHWIWDSGMNVALAGGMGHTWISDSDSSISMEGTLPTGYLRIGKTF